jgi:hypothetical protein
VTADPIPDRSFASVPPAIQHFDRNAEHLGQLWQSHKPLRRFLVHDRLPSRPDASVVRRLPSSHAGRTGGLLIAELVDNRCRCKPLQTPEGGQLSLAVILCRNLVQRGLRLSVGASDLLGTSLTHAYRRCVCDRYELISPQTPQGNHAESEPR